MKARWAHAAFGAWRRGVRCLARWWSAVYAGRLEDGTLHARTIVGYGDALFPASGRGRKSTPTTAMRKAAQTAAGAVAGALHATPLVSEYGSTKHHRGSGGCGAVLGAVRAPPSKAHIARHAAKVLRSQSTPDTPMPWGWTRAPPPPPRPLRQCVTVHGMQHCAPCRALVGRDKDAGAFVMDATVAHVCGELPPPAMRRGWDGGPKPPPFVLQHRG